MTDPPEQQALPAATRATEPPSSSDNPVQTPVAVPEESSVKRPKKMMPVTVKEKAQDLCDKAFAKATEAAKLAKALAGVPYSKDVHDEMVAYDQLFTWESQ